MRLFHLHHKNILGNQTSSPLGRLGEESTSVWKLLSFLSFLVLIFVFSSCSDTTNDIVNPSDGADNRVLISLTAQSTIADNTLSDGNSTRTIQTEASEGGEKMKNWFVVVTKGDSIESILSSDNINGETDADSVYTRLSNGLTTFYSFANLQPSDIGLGGAKAGDRLPVGFETQALTIYGNQRTAADFSGGIPMSNKEQFTVTSTTSRIDLETIRMVAKLRLAITNTTDSAVTIQSVSLSDVTRNATGNINILPGAITDETTGERTPNIANAATNSTQTYSFSDNSVTPSVAGEEIASGETKNIEVYLNESKADDDPGYFVLSMTTRRNANDSVQTRRYSFLQWKSIARNELRVVPINLSDYQIQFDVRPYTAIGVLPRIDNSRSDIATIAFGLYGHYDIVPYVMKLSTRERVDTMTTVSYTFDETAVLGDGSFITGLGWNYTARPPRIECIVGNITGWAIYDINAKFTLGTVNYSVTRRFRLSNQYVDLSQLAKKRLWQERRKDNKIVLTYNWKEGK